MYIKFFIFIIIMALSTCDKDNDNNGNKSKAVQDAQLVLELFDKSSETLKIGQEEYILEAYLWRDFQPISPPDGKPLSSINRLINVDSTDISLKVDLVEQYVIKNDYVWITPYDHTSPHTPGFRIEKISRNGPKWGPDIHVDVIAKVRDLDTDRNYFIRKENVNILRTD